MILLLSTCKEKLSEEEYVRPISDILDDSCQRYEIRHYLDRFANGRYDKIIICGTAKIDNDFLLNLDKFEFLNDCNAKVLGICSGMQAIGLAMGARLDKSNEIGMTDIKMLEPNILFETDFEAYCLHGNSLKDLKNFRVLAMSRDCVQAIKHSKKDIYGIMFHPEVRNKEIIKRFIKL